MPAQIVLVHDEEPFAAAVARALLESGYQVMVFPDPLVALQALETADRLELLITTIGFPEGRSNGQALALMARRKRRGAKVLFLSPPEWSSQIADLGEVLLAPATVSDVVETAMRLSSRPPLPAPWMAASSPSLGNRGQICPETPLPNKGPCKSADP